MKLIFSVTLTLGDDELENITQGEDLSKMTDEELIKLQANALQRCYDDEYLDGTFKVDWVMREGT